MWQFEGPEVATNEIRRPPNGLKISPRHERFLGMPSYDFCLRCGFESGIGYQGREGFRRSRDRQMTVVASQDADAPLQVTVLDMFKRSDRKWIVAGSLERGTLRQGQRVTLRAVEATPVGATVTGFNLSSISVPQVDFLIETDTAIERRLPATIESDV
ncbi:MAG: hypothetical protein ABI140_04250 [Jatrophihabitantaceae bacterium]